MFLKGLKAKSVLKKMGKVSETRQYQPSTGKIKTLAILQNRSFPFDSSKIKELANALGIVEREVQLLEYSASISKEQKAHSGIYNASHLGWKGVFKNKSLKDFEKSNFDILLSYYHTDELALQAMTVFSNARIKVGISHNFEHLNDLTICVSNNEEALLIEELKKYLKILKVLN